MRLLWLATKWGLWRSPGPSIEAALRRPRPTRRAIGEAAASAGREPAERETLPSG